MAPIKLLKTGQNRGNNRIYYRSKSRLYCIQEYPPNNLCLCLCNDHGEPDVPIPEENLPNFTLA